VKKKYKRLYTGINIQWPISQLILSGEKIVETRTYPIPKPFLNTDMILIETPGKEKKFKSRMVAIIRFTECFAYKSKREFYQDKLRHLVAPESPWSWKDKQKWGWKVEIKRVFKKPVPIQKRTGIKYSKDISL
jgi:hypothetical protein